MPEYSVYLVEQQGSKGGKRQGSKGGKRQGSQGGKRQVTSPVDGTDLDFYDSGVWLTRESGRNFFPYDEIRTIREHSGEETAESERQDSSEETGDPGAEEELLE